MRSGNPWCYIPRTAHTSLGLRSRLHSYRTYSSVINASQWRPSSAWKNGFRKPQATLRCSLTPKRRFCSGLPSILVPPVVFVGLLAGLWTYKCVMTVLFQDKIIYMPYIGRKEKLETYAASCKPVEWEPLHIRSRDGTRIALCIGRMRREEAMADESKKRKIVICYFQGNGSSTPPRLPLLSNTLKAIEARARDGDHALNVEFVLITLSYRGYWTSSGRASQRGIEKDAQAMLQWVNATQAEAQAELQLILWGQSIGAGVATTAASQYMAAHMRDGREARITALVLETPFTGIKSMLLALYPQKWLPYQYLWPFLWNHWDSSTALRTIASAKYPPRVLIMPATRDEVVPSSEADRLEKISRDAGLCTQRTDVIGALHTEASTRREGQLAVADFVVKCVKEVP